MKKTVFLAIGMAVCLSACRKQTFEERVAQEVKEFNEKEAPKRQNMYTMFDSMTFVPEQQTLSYYYTVEGDGEQLFPNELMKENILKGVRSSLALKSHKEHELNLQYKYYGKSSGKVLMDVTFTPEDYN
ncbi:MAG: hypothetical protein K2H79_06610 [Bacteroidaceae bacterium]|nr:hypothetical protein [Bacteroidaceae bacterium]